MVWYQPNADQQEIDQKYKYEPSFRSQIQLHEFIRTKSSSAEAPYKFELKYFFADSVQFKLTYHVQ